MQPDPVSVTEAGRDGSAFSFGRILNFGGSARWGCSQHGVDCCGERVGDEAGFAEGHSSVVLLNLGDGVCGEAGGCCELLLGEVGGGYAAGVDCCCESAVELEAANSSTRWLVVRTRASR
jgi:hypothetical protein